MASISQVHYTRYKCGEVIHGELMQCLHKHSDALQYINSTLHIYMHNYFKMVQW